MLKPHKIKGVEIETRNANAKYSDASLVLVIAFSFSFSENFASLRLPCFLAKASGRFFCSAMPPNEWQFPSELAQPMAWQPA